MVLFWLGGQILVSPRGSKMSHRTAPKRFDFSPGLIYSCDKEDTK